MIKKLYLLLFVSLLCLVQAFAVITTIGESPRQELLAQNTFAYIEQNDIYYTAHKTAEGNNSCSDFGYRYGVDYNNTEYCFENRFQFNHLRDDLYIQLHSLIANNTGSIQLLIIPTNSISSEDEKEAIPTMLSQAELYLINVQNGGNVYVKLAKNLQREDITVYVSYFNATEGVPGEMLTFYPKEQFTLGRTANNVVLTMFSVIDFFYMLWEMAFYFVVFMFLIFVIFFIMNIFIAMHRNIKEYKEERHRDRRER